MKNLIHCLLKKLMSKNRAKLKENSTITPKEKILIFLSKEYFNSLKLNTAFDIHGLSEENIYSLKTIIFDNTFKGGRASNLVKKITEEFGINKDNADLLVKHETSVLMSRYHRQRYIQSGVNKYKWSTSKDQRVRDSHKKLDGKVFGWDNPPITNEQGDRNHPGEDFLCRCVAIPILT